MVQTLEAIKGGGGSIKVGTTGTISALMSRELESMKSAHQLPVSSRNKLATVSVLVPGGSSTAKVLKPKTSMDEASSSNSIKHKGPEITRRTKQYNQRTHQIPMLGADNISLEGTPIREKPEKRVPYRVEIVDIKCGNPDRTWASPITNRLKKLGFSKLSESIG